LELWQFPFQQDSFGTSIRKVIDAVQFFESNPDLREMLPRWQPQDAMFGTFDFPEEH